MYYPVAKAKVSVKGAAGEIRIVGENKTMVLAEPSRASYSSYQDVPEYGSLNWGKAVGKATLAAVVTGSVVIVVASYGAAGTVVWNVAVGSLAVTSLAGGRIAYSNIKQGSISGMEVYLAEAVYAEMIYLTNLGAGVIATQAGFGFGGTIALKNAAMSLQDAGYQQAVYGEVDRGLLIMNLATNPALDFITLQLSKNNKNAKGSDKGTSGDGDIVDDVPERPSWQQSERDAGELYPGYESQKSFLDGEEAPHGTKEL